ncbi:AI-2E family transporter [Paractinoplanes brasiliensis]|uniref:Putative PurR-regulated permease PerM n=1 Tax=Paractinoplanes brasiliensis TaxID=52695 RepID=A0A4R6J7G3_9ACTN|nr:AI-2E family transporter [Actinoplanes brasiliensis]TDO31464.1 putative PurR-regulated permease PerM [Actinoplanes brasiliensis]GID30859.1 AI-2E family transporter [Actinoplanes brasiliensis]
MSRLVARPPRHTLRIAGRGNGAAPGDPAGLPRGVVVLLGTACLVIAVAGIRATAELLAPVMLALMLTVTASPLTQWLRRHGSPVWFAMLATIITVYVVLFALGSALFVSVARLIDLLPQYQAQFAGLRDDLVTGLSGLGVSAAQLRDLVAGADPATFVRLAEGLVGGLTGLLSNTVFLLAVLLFMCLDTVSFPERLTSVTGERPQVVTALRTFAQGTRRYLLVSTVFGLIVAVFDTVLLWWLDVPLPLLWGLLSFITNYIPNVGFVIGLIPPALLALLQGGPDLMLTVVLLYCMVNFVIQSVIQPKIVGDAVGLSATVSFLSLVFWTWVLGALGALLAIPLTLLAKGLLVDIDPSTRWLNVLLTGGRAPDSPTRDEAPARPRRPA